VFEIIRETWHTHPKLCIKALQAFLDLLQGQAPSGLKYEPKDITSRLITCSIVQVRVFAIKHSNVCTRLFLLMRVCLVP